MRNRISVFLACMAVQLMGGQNVFGQTYSMESSLQSVSQRFAQRTEQSGIVGGIFAFVQKSEPATITPFGLADVESQRAVSEQTIFHWASITKTFTAIAVMQLRDEGKLSLDDPVVDFLPEIARIHNPFGSIRDITIYHLLTHSSGLRNSTWPWGGGEEWHPHEPTEWSQVVAMFPYSRIEFEPGSRFRYSNPAIIFLGQIIERISGEPYETYIDKNILKPLEMYSSYFDHSPRHLIVDRSNNYFLEDGKLSTNGLDFDTGITVSNGGLNAPVSDMVRYLRFLLGSENKQTAYDLVLQRSSLLEMWVPQMEIGTEDSIDVNIGLAFFLMKGDSATYPGHTGGQKGFVSFFNVDVASGRAVISGWNTLVVDTAEEVSPTRALLSATRTDVFENLFR